MAEKMLSLHVGASEISEDFVDAPNDPSFASDARVMQALAQDEEFTTRLLVGPEATRARVEEQIRQDARDLQEGSLYLLTFAGHGLSLEDSEVRERGLVVNQSWILFDDEIFDDEVDALLHAFQPGVFILVTSDSCNSGTIVTPPARAAAAAARRSRREGWARVLAPEVVENIRERRSRRRPRAAARLAPAAAALQAYVLAMSACQDDQVAELRDGSGVFTSAVLEIWNQGQFQDHETFFEQVRDRVVALTGGDQVPNFLQLEPESPRFLATRPFDLP